MSGSKLSVSVAVSDSSDSSELWEELTVATGVRLLSSVSEAESGSESSALESDADSDSGSESSSGGGT